MMCCKHALRVVRRCVSVYPDERLVGQFAHVGEVHEYYSHVAVVLMVVLGVVYRDRNHAVISSPCGLVVAPVGSDV